MRERDIEKLAFFGPDKKKYGLTVMPFDPVNAPSFYTCMMDNFKSEWDNFFIQWIPDMATSGTLLNRSKVTILGMDIMVGDVKINSGTKSIINNILIWNGRITVIIIYFECVCMVFQRY